jgi:uncharacterized membrane protein
MSQKIPQANSTIFRLMMHKGERTVVFFDAVMAIAITLLVLEVALPESPTFGLDQLHDLFAPFTAFFISFIVLGQVWYMHAKTFAYEGFVRHASMSEHLVLMFFVILFPKTTGLIQMYPSSPYAIAIYLLCYIALVAVEGFTILRSYLRLTRRFESEIASKHHLSIDRKNFFKAAHELSNTSFEPMHVIDALKQLFAIEFVTLALSMVATIGSVLALFLYPIACYIFFAIDITVMAILSKKMSRKRKIVMSLIDESEPYNDGDDDEN